MADPRPTDPVARKRYDERVNRARAAPKMSLDLSKLAVDSQIPEGEHQLTHREETMLVTPRAKQKEAITVRGAPKHRTIKLVHLAPADLGRGPVKFAWRPRGEHFATLSYKMGECVVQLWTRKGDLVARHGLAESKPVWVDWDCKGEVLGMLTERDGIFIWDLGKGSAEKPMHLSPKHTSTATFCKWSLILPHLAIGTSDGKVIIYNRIDSVLQLHERKGSHGAPVLCGDWLPSNSLGLASGTRVKVSQPIAETNSKWESYSKFNLGGIKSKVPKHIRQAGEPRHLAFTPTYPHFVAVALGTKYVLTFDTTRVHEDLGLTFPEDYGGICGFQWMQNNLLLVGLANGYVVTVDFAALTKLQEHGQLPDKIAAMATTQVFNEYVAAIHCAPTDYKIAACGDAMVKIVEAKGVELEVTAEIHLERKLKVGEFLDNVKWDQEGRAVACSATDGYLYVYEVH